MAGRARCPHRAGRKEARINGAGWDPYDQNASSEFFDPEWVFNIKDGFDVVIGNPPYGVVNKRQNKGVSIVVDERTFAQFKDSDHYAPSRGKGLLNIYRLFVQKSLELLVINGIFSEIFPLAFAGDLSAASLRRFVFSRYRGLKFEAFPERDDPNRRVFEAAKMSVCILIAKNDRGGGSLMIRVNDNRYVDFSKKAFPISSKMLFEMDSKYVRMPIVTETEYGILYKIREKFQSVGTIYRCATGELDMTFAKDAFTTSTRFSEMIRGAGIGRYEIREEMSQGGYLYINESNLKNRDVMRQLKESERIVLQGITGVNEKWRLKATLAKSVYCANSTNYIFVRGTVARLILGIFNSRLMNFYFGRFSTNSNVNGYEVDELPMPTAIGTTATTETNETIADNTVASQIATLVDRILAAKKADSAADTSVLEAEIDQLVYKLYGLTEEEIAVVEGRGADTAPDGTGNASERIKVAPGKPRRRSTVEAVNEDDEELE